MTDIVRHYDTAQSEPNYVSCSMIKWVFMLAHFIRFVICNDGYTIERYIHGWDDVSIMIQKPCSLSQDFAH